jgi:uncharacterized membrane protein YdbT with pleckstrin-like domain
VLSLIQRWLRVPGEPHDPEGQALLVFRADAGYYRYRLTLFWILRVMVFLLFTYVGFLAVLISAAVLAEDRGKKSLFERVNPGVLQTIIIVVTVVLALLFVVQCVISWATLRLDFDLRWYKVTDRSLRIREGVWFVREMTMSFANIQNISVSQGPIQKYFGVSDLIVQSAGGGEQSRALHTGYFRGVADAEKVKALMLARLRRHRDAGLGDGDERPVTMEDALREVRDEARALREGVVRG